MIKTELSALRGQSRIQMPDTLNQALQKVQGLSDQVIKSLEAMTPDTVPCLKSVEVARTQGLRR